MRLILLHGWKVRDAAASIGLLEEPLRALGFEVWRADYGHVLAPWTTRMRSRTVAKGLALRLAPGDVLIGHSNGSRCAWETSWEDWEGHVRTMVLLNPALDPFMEPGPGVRRCLVLANRRDWTTRLAALVPGSPWGSMGTHGYHPLPGWNNDPRMQTMLVDERGDPHSFWKANPAYWAGVIARFIRAEPVLMESA